MTTQQRLPDYVCVYYTDVTVSVCDCDTITFTGLLSVCDSITFAGLRLINYYTFLILNN